MKNPIVDGTARAHGEHHEVVERPVLESVDALMRLIPNRRTRGGSGPALHSAVAKFLTFINSTAQDTPIHLLETKMEQFNEYLQDRHYAKETVKSYRYCLNVLLKIARDYGWEPPIAIMSADWNTVMALKSGKEVRSIIRFANRIGKTPSTFDEDDLGAWCQERIQAGRTFEACRTNMSLFRSLMSRPELSALRPLVRRKLANYGVPLRNMAPWLRSEIEDLLSYLTDEGFDRDGDPIGSHTADRLRGEFERLVGFVENIRILPRVESLSSLVTRAQVADYLKWAWKERGVQGKTLFSGLSQMHSALNKHPRYNDLDLNWLPPMLAKLPKVERSEIDRRKDKKRIDFKVANAIPGKIRQARLRTKELTDLDLAISLRNELIMLWLVILPWRGRNVRESRISRGSHPNLFFALIPKHSSLTKPKWLIEQEKEYPGKPVWQVDFRTTENKSKKEVRGFLPRELVMLLDEYLAHRSALIPAGGFDPGTLFLNTKGKPMTSHQLRGLVESLTSLHAGKAVNPHLFRDMVAYEWLSEHPEDFATVSKLLWHSSVEFTMRVYGSQFNESTGMARMDDWRASMKKAA